MCVRTGRLRFRRIRIGFQDVPVEVVHDVCSHKVPVVVNHQLSFGVPLGSVGVESGIGMSVGEDGHQGRIGECELYLRIAVEFGVSEHPTVFGEDRRDLHSPPAEHIHQLVPGLELGGVDEDSRGPQGEGQVTCVDSPAEVEGDPLSVDVDLPGTVDRSRCSVLGFPSPHVEIAHLNFIEGSFLRDGEAHAPVEV